MPKRFNPLIDRPPETVEVNGREYRIEADYRTVLAYQRLLQDPETDDQDKAVLGLSLFFGDQIRREDVQDLLAYSQYFINRGQEPQDDDRDAPKREKTFDILEDSGRIFAAFLQVYGINLRKAKIHWWIFWDLLEGLPTEGTKLSAVLEIRGRQFRTDMTPAERNSLARLKEYYKIGDDAPDVMTGLFNSLLGISQ
jgi:hypothetical protein